MWSFESIKYSLRNLKKRKIRSSLTIFSILIGIATIYIFLSFGIGLYVYVGDLASTSSADKIIVLPKSAGTVGFGENIVLNESDVNVVSKSPGVYQATGAYFRAVEIRKNNVIKYVFLLAYEPKEDFIFESFNVETKQGRRLSSGDENVVLLGYNYQVPDKIFKKAYGLNDKIEVNGEKLKIIGFLEEIGNPTDDSQIYMSSQKYEDSFPEDSYDQIYARVNIDKVDEVVENVEKNLRKSRDLEEGKEDFSVESFNSLIESFTGALDIIVGFVILIALISVLVSTINTANTMVTSVLERYKEIGILKAIGSRNSEIFGIFLFESSFLGFVAGCLGCLLGWGLANLGGNILSDLGWGFIQPYFSVYLVLSLILFAVITGALSGVIPSVNASKINTVDALRYE